MSVRQCVYKQCTIVTPEGLGLWKVLKTECLFYALYIDTGQTNCTKFVVNRYGFPQLPA